MWWISLLLIFLAGIFNACMDIIKIRWIWSIFYNVKNEQWFNPSLSWRNKWKDGHPDKGEKFLGSSTIFVFVTDFWHFCKFLMLLCISFSIVLYQPIFFWLIDWLLFYLIFTVTFELFFSKILKRN